MGTRSFRTLGWWDEIDLKRTCCKFGGLSSFYYVIFWPEWKIELKLNL